MSDETTGTIAGTIEPNPNGGKPIFRIIRKYSNPDAASIELGHEDAGVRPCAHPSFILDERWATVTCAECKERVDAFSALIRYAEWWEQFQHRRAMHEQAERSLHHTRLRTLARHRCFSDAEQAEMLDATQSGRLGLPELRELVRRMEGLERERRWAKRQAAQAPHAVTP